MNFFSPSLHRPCTSLNTVLFSYNCLVIHRIPMFRIKPIGLRPLLLRRSKMHINRCFIVFSGMIFSFGDDLESRDTGWTVLLWLADYYQSYDIATVRLTNTNDTTISVVCIPLKQGETQPSWTPFVKAISEWTFQTIEGDVNADGTFNVADVVALQKWLLAVPDTKLANWKAGNFCSDNRLDVFDLCLMKRELLKNN